MRAAQTFQNKPTDHLRNWGFPSGHTIPLGSYQASILNLQATFLYSIYHQRAGKTNLFHMRGGRFQAGNTLCISLPLSEYRPTLRNIVYTNIIKPFLEQTFWRTVWSSWGTLWSCTHIWCMSVRQCWVYGAPSSDTPAPWGWVCTSGHTRTPALF